MTFRNSDCAAGATAFKMGTTLLRLLRVSDRGQHTADDGEQFIDGLKSRGSGGGDMLDLGPPHGQLRYRSPREVE